MERIPIDKEWSNALYSLRCERGLSQYEVALNCKISKTMICRLETCHAKTISEENLRKLEEFYGVKLTPLCSMKLIEDTIDMIDDLRKENKILRQLVIHLLDKSCEANKVGLNVLAKLTGTDPEKSSLDDITKKLLFGGYYETI